MTNVTLHKIKRKHGACWALRWYGTDGKRYGESLGSCRKLPKRDAEALRRAKQGKLDCGVVRPDRPGRMTLDAFAEQYPGRRRRGDTGRGFLRGAPKLSAKTIRGHAMTLRYMVEHFGGDQAIEHAIGQSLEG